MDKLSDEVLTEKTCTKCHHKKPISSFGKEKRSIRGLRSECKECKSKEDKKWRKENREIYLQSQKEWRDKNPHKKIENVKRIINWMNINPEKVKAKQYRYRGLGYEPLNEKFEGAEGHHINEYQVIYIPKALHRSLWHSVSKNINMDIINEKAFEFLYEKEAV
ncbi:MAG: hypothetical protein WC332_00650 [Clostridia bacterium]|jgi:hypothetical protein